MTTAEELRIRFPRASESFIRANSVAIAPPDRAKQGKLPKVGASEPSADTPRKSQPIAHHAKTSPSPKPDPITDALTAAFERAKADYRASLALVERALGDGPLAAGEGQDGHPRKFLVRVTSYRVRLLDEDNLCEKYHVDLCRYAGLLRSDAAGKARIVTTQEKVGSREDERTVIEIYPNETISN